ncbi:pyridoxal-phosphate dependent enzyme [Candidatus Riflebacteria bacterium]
MTPLLSVQEIGNIFLKLENRNPSGLHKNRIYRNIPEYYALNPVQFYSLGSCGNSALCAMHYLENLPVELHIFIPESFLAFYKQRFVEKAGGQVLLHKVNGTYEAAIKMSRDFCSEKGGGEDISTASSFFKKYRCSYRKIIDEVALQLNEDYDSITWFIPIGDGGTFFELKSGANENRWKRQRFFGVSVPHYNSIYESLRMGLGEHKPLDPAIIKVDEYNIPLLNWNAAYGRECFQQLKKFSAIIGPEREQVLKARKRLESTFKGKFGVVSSVVFAGLNQYLHRSSESVGNKNSSTAYVAILTD